MPQYLALVTLNKKSGIPADAVQNSFAFASETALGDSALEACGESIATFYNDANGAQPVSIASLLSASLSTEDGDNLIEWYEITDHLDGTPHGSSIFTQTWTLGDQDADSMPDEVAIVLSFHGTYGTSVEFGAGGTRPRARKRGRLFIGPIGVGNGVLDADTKELRLSSTARAAVVHAGPWLQNTVPFGTWSIWSRADEVLVPISDWWVDDAYDIQRRRGNSPTVRTSAGLL